MVLMTQNLEEKKSLFEPKKKLLPASQAFFNLSFFFSFPRSY